MITHKPGILIIS